VPLVLLRAHDCITAFLGSRARYARHFEEKPGTYFETTGWLERGVEGVRTASQQTGGLGFDLATLAAKYGEDNARYILETMTRHYRRVAFVRMGIEPDSSFEERTRALATERGFEFEALDGDLGSCIGSSTARGSLSTSSCSSRASGSPPPWATR